MISSGGLQNCCKLLLLHIFNTERFVNFLNDNTSFIVLEENIKFLEYFKNTFLLQDFL